jgi:hypothetical protein
MKKQFDFFFKIASSPNFNLKDYYKNDKTLLKLHKQFEKELTNKFTMKGGVYEEYNPVLLQQIVDNASGQISGPGGTNAHEYCNKLEHHLRDQIRDIIYDNHTHKLILLPTYIDGTTGKKFYKEDFKRLKKDNSCNNIPDDLIEGFVDPDTKTTLPSEQSGLLAAHTYGSMDELHGLIFHGDSDFTPEEQQRYRENRQQNINEAQYARGKTNHDLYKSYKAKYPDHNKGGPATTTTPATTTPATKAAQQEPIFEY